MTKKEEQALEKAKERMAKGGPKGSLYHPFYNNYALGRNVRQPFRSLDYKILRRVAQKAWLINTIIGHISDKIVPYMKPIGDKGRRGFNIVMKDYDGAPKKDDLKRIRSITEFFMNTGWGKDPNRDDDLVSYTKKIVRDLYTLDQVATEVQKKRTGEPFAFWALDAATIARCIEEGYDGDDKYKYVQMIDEMVVAKFSAEELIFQFASPRTDIEATGYGYSKVEQAIDLVVSLINSFVYNAGSFTDDKLPRGMLLLNGDAGFSEVQEMEDYLTDVMSSPTGPLGKWTIPIIPAGGGKEGQRSLEWIQMNSSNQDMQYSRWQDTLYMSIGALFGIDVESMGIKSEKSAKIIESGSAEARRYSDDKGVGSTLTFLERHFQKILDMIDPTLKFVFVGFEQDDSKEVQEAEESALRTKKSLNEIRKADDLEEIKEPWANVPGIGNSQIYQAWAMAQQQQEQPEDQGDEDMGDFGDDSGDDEQQIPDNIFEKSINDEIVIVV
jgi:hypothetical protein